LPVLDGVSPEFIGQAVMPNKKNTKFFSMYITKQFKLVPKRRWQREYLFRLFREVTWFRNWTIADIQNRLDPNNANKIKLVEVKCGGKFESRELAVLGSQMKQCIQSEIIWNMKAIKERKTGKGKLKFQSEHTSLPLSNQSFKIKGNGVTFQKLNGRKIYLRGLKQFRNLGKIQSAVLLKRAKGYFINVVFEVEDRKQEPPLGKSVGIDFGIRTAITFSNGLKVHYRIPVPRRVKSLQRKLSRCTRGSKNWWKVKELLKRSYEDMTDVKRDITNRIFAFCKLYRNVGIQDELIKQWQKRFGKQIQSMQHGKVLESLKQRHSNCVVIDRYVPTTSVCCLCGQRQKIGLEERTFRCPNCGSTIDRDLNAARNIEKLAFLVPLERGEVTLVEKEASARIFGPSPYILVSHAFVEARS